MANRYWVGGTGSWDGTNTTNWSDQSNGSGGFSVPTTTDDVFFDGSSGTGTVTIATGNTGAKSITCTGYTGTLTGTAAITVAGSVTLVSGMTHTYTGNITITRTGTITSAGKTLCYTLAISGSGIVVTLGEDLSISGFLAVSTGTFNLSTYSCTALTFTSSTTTSRSLVFGSGSKIIITGSDRTVWNTTIAVNFTVTGTSRVEYTYSGSTGTRIISGPSTAGLNGPVSHYILSGSDNINAEYYLIDLDFTGFSGSLTHSGATRTLYGNLTISSGMTVTTTSAITTFAATSGTQTITSNGKTLGCPVTINAPNATVQLGDALNLGSNQLNVTAGTFTTTASNYNVTAQSLQSSSISEVRAIFLNGSTFTISGAGTVLNFSNPANLTFNAGTSSIVFTNTATIFSTGQTFYNVLFTSTSASINAIDGVNTFNDVSVTASSSAGSTFLLFFTNQTINGTLSTVSTAGNRRVYFQSSTLGTTRTLTVNTTPNLTDADFRDITVSGTAAPISGTRIGDQGGNSGITFSTPKTVYWNLAGGGNWNADAWAATSGTSVSTDNFPLPQDTAIIENTGLNTSATITLLSAVAVGTIDMSTRTNAMTLATGGATVYGSWANGSGTTLSGTTAITFAGRNTQTITSAGKTFTCPITVDSPGGTVQLGDALNIGTNALTITRGTFTTTASNYNVTASRLLSSNSTTRTISLNGSTVTLSGGANNGVDFGTSTNLTFNSGTSSIILSPASNNTTTLNGGTGLTFYNVSFNLQSTASIIGVNTFNNLTATFTGGSSIVTFSSNQTINGTLSTSSTAGNRRVYFRSDTFGTTRTLTVNATPSLTNADFRDITVTGTAAPISGTRIGDQGGNSGITFSTPKTVYWNLAAGGGWNADAWAASSGASPSTDNFPLPQDTAIIENTGLNTSATITLQISVPVCTVDMSTRTNAVTIATAVTAYVYGNWTNGSGVSFTGSGLVFSGQNAQTITSNGVSMPSIYIESPGGTVMLGDNLTTSSFFTLTAGTLDLNTDKILSTTNVNLSGTSTRAIAFGTSGKIQVSLNGATVWDAATLTNFSYTGTSLVELVGGSSSGTRTITHGSTAGGSESTAISFTIVDGSGSGVITTTASSHIKDLIFGSSFTGSLSNTIRTIYGNLTVSTGMTVTAGANTTTFAATSGIQDITSNGKTFDFPITIDAPSATVRLQDNLTFGSTRPITLTAGTLDLNTDKILNAGIFSTNNSNTRSIVFGTSGKIQVTATSGAPWEGSTLTNFSYTGASLVELTGAPTSGTRTINHGITNGNETRAISFSVIAGSGTAIISVGNQSKIKNLDFTGFSGSWANTVRTIYGNLIISTGMTLTAGTSGTTFAATSGTQDITSNGKTFDFPITIDAPSATVRLIDALTVGSTRTTTLTAGTFNANNQNFTTGLFNGSGSTTRTLTMGSGTWTLSGTGTVWDMTTPTTLTFNKDAANIVLSNTSTTARTFAGGGLTYNDLTIGGATGTSTLTFTGSNTFGTIASTKTVAHTIRFTAGTNTTVSNWTVSGTAGNIVTLTSPTAAKHTLTKTGGGKINVSYMNISYSDAAPSNTWYALTTDGNINGKNNTGWVGFETANIFLVF